MTIDDEFRQAFAAIERYEKYKLVRTTGILIFVIGCGRFLLSWILDQTLLFSFNVDFMTIQIIRLIVQMVIILILVSTLIYSYISIKKTSIRQGGRIVSSMDVHFGIAICLLIYLTFFLHVIASVYFEEVLGIFLYYFILKRGLENDFRELRNLGIVLLVISMIEVASRIFLVVALYGHQIFLDIWTIFYIGIAVVFMIPYIIFGIRIFRNASSTLEEI